MAHSEVAPDRGLPGHSLASFAVDPGPGSSLEPATRDRLERRLAGRVPDVRIHRGPAASSSAEALGVPAFTVGRDIVLGPSVDRQSPAGDAILAHEVAHTLQQAGADRLRPGPLARTHPGDAVEIEAGQAALGRGRPTAGAPLAIAAAPADVAPALPKPATFKELWPTFQQATHAFDPVKSTAIARELATAPYDFPDLLEHGIDVVVWLEQHGEPDAAAELLAEIRRVWLIEFVSLDSKLPNLDWGTSDPAHLISLGAEAARAGKDDQAFRFLGVANEILSYYALTLTEKRMIHVGLDTADDEARARAAGGGSAAEKAIREAGTFPRMIGRSIQYSTMAGIYDQMRRIYSVYPVLEREAIGAGDTAAAGRARTRSGELKAEIKREYTWGKAQAPGPMSQEVREPVEIAEVSYADTPKGPGLTLHGANQAETDLTQLPGLPAPKEVGNAVQIQNLGSLQEALMAQTDFQAEVGRVAEVRAAFGNEPVDLNDQAKRQRLWRIMYGVFAAAGPGPLRALMSLIGRYLKAYTVHTTFNVRDWGTSYLDSSMPTDLAGRAERDCGVYALTVAWDVFQTVKGASPKLDVGFDLVTMLEHVTLIITDRSANEYYMVNNDVVSEPQTGKPAKSVSGAYGAVRQLHYAVGPSVTVGIGSTKDSAKTFHDQVWTRYMAAVDWGLKPQIPPEVERLKTTDPAAYTRKTAELQQARYDQFYPEQATFDSEARALDTILDGLAAVAGDPAKLGAELDKRIDVVGRLLVGFIRLGPSAGIIAGSTRTQAILPSRAEYLYALPPGRTAHPLARFAAAILHLHALGRPATTLETAYLTLNDRIDDFRDHASSYQAAGAMGQF